MFGWLKRRTAPRTGHAAWTVVLEHATIIVRDNLGHRRSLPVAALHRVIINSADHLPWRMNFTVLLYTTDPDPVAFFPLDATGSPAFFEWLRTRPGFDAHQLTAALSARKVARFEVLHAERASRITHTTWPNPANVSLAVNTTPGSAASDAPIAASAAQRLASRSQS